MLSIPARSRAPPDPLQAIHGGVEGMDAKRSATAPLSTPNAAQTASWDRHYDPVLVNINPDIRDTISKTRPLCMRLGTGRSGATLVTCILRDGSPGTRGGHVGVGRVRCLLLVTSAPPVQVIRSLIITASKSDELATGTGEPRLPGDYADLVGELSVIVACRRTWDEFCRQR